MLTSVVPAALMAVIAVFVTPDRAHANNDALHLTFSTSGEVVSFGLSPTTPTRRFTYGDFGENRVEKGVRSFKLSMGGIPGEISGLLTFPFREPKTTAVFLLGITALVAVDRQTTAFWQDNVEPVFDDIQLPDLFETPSWYPLRLSAESKLMLTTIGLTYAGGLAFNDERAQTAALLSTKAIAYSYLTSQVILKPIFGRLRPVENLSTFTGDPGDFTTDPWQFGHDGGIPFNGGAFATAMPSFHFTQYFAMARIYSGVYDNYAIPYLAAGAISAANIRDHRHWVSDMVAGALIGTGIGNLILNSYEDRKEGQDNALLIPVISTNSIGFSFSMDF